MGTGWTVGHAGAAVWSPPMTASALQGPRVDSLPDTLPRLVAPERVHSSAVKLPSWGSAWAGAA